MSTTEFSNSIKINAELDVIGEYSTIAMIYAVPISRQALTGTMTIMNSNLWGTPVFKENTDKASFITYVSSPSLGFKISRAGLYRIDVSIGFRQRTDGATYTSRFVSAQMYKNGVAITGSSGSTFVDDLASHTNTTNSLYLPWLESIAVNDVITIGAQQDSSATANSTEVQGVRFIIQSV